MSSPASPESRWCAQPGGRPPTAELLTIWSNRSPPTGSSQDPRVSSTSTPLKREGGPGRASALGLTVGGPRLLGVPGCVQRLHPAPGAKVDQPPYRSRTVSVAMLSGFLVRSMLNDCIAFVRLIILAGAVRRECSDSHPCPARRNQ